MPPPLADLLSSLHLGGFHLPPLQSPAPALGCPHLAGGRKETEGLHLLINHDRKLGTSFPLSLLAREKSYDTTEQQRSSGNVVQLRGVSILRKAEILGALL